MLGWSNSKNGLLFLIFSTAVSSFVQASDTWKSDSLFLMGYQSFINHQYAQCADNFFSSIENGIAQESRARLYLASCQTKLGSRGPAAYHLAQINEDDLNNREKGEYRRLSTLLKSQLDETGLQAWLTPFFGVLMYDTKSTSLAATKTNAPISAGVFYGLQSSFIKDSWIISMGGQVMSFPQTDGTNSTQITGLLGVDKQLGSSFSLWAKGIYIYSSNTSLQSEVIGGTGFQWYWSPAVKVKVDYFYSSYPYFSFGPMTLSQISGSLTWNFVQSEKLRSYLQSKPDPPPDVQACPPPSTPEQE